ncbi:MAG: hypothetical protein AAGB93_06105 [Planctomycetota bacterium]
MRRLTVLSSLAAAASLALVSVALSWRDLGTLHAVAPHAGRWLFALDVLALVLCAAVFVGALRAAPGHGLVAPSRLWAVPCVFVLWCAAYQVWGQPFRPATVVTSAGVAAGAYAAMAWTRGRSKARWSEVCARWTVVVCVTALSLELALAVLGALRPTPLLSTSLWSVSDRVASFALRPGSVRFGFPVNARGFYDEEFRAESERTRPAVALLGDSFGVGIVPHDRHYSTVAERALDDVDVYSIAVRGLGPAGYLHLLRTEVLRLEPDAIVLAVFAGNDLLDVPMSRRSTRWMRRFFDRDQLLVRVVPRRITALQRSRRAGAATGAEGDGLESGSEPWFDDHALEVATFSDGEYREIVRKRARVLNRPHPRRLAVLLSTLERMRDAAGDVPFGVVVLPAELQIEDRLWNEVEAYLGGGADVERFRFQSELAAWGDSEGVPVLDLAPALLAYPPEADGDRHLYHLRDTHFNVRGNALTGRELAPFFEALLR